MNGPCGTGCTSQSARVGKLALQVEVWLATQQPNQRFSFTPMSRTIEEDETLRAVQCKSISLTGTLSNLLIMDPLVVPHVMCDILPKEKSITRVQ